MNTDLSYNMLEQTNYTLAKNLKAKPIENDIFNEDWETNLINLANSITR